MRAGRANAGSALALSACVATWACGGDAGAPGSADAASEAEVPTEGVYGMAHPVERGVPSVVTLTPHGPVEVEWPEAPTIDQLGLQFSPRHTLVPVGGSVRFHNSEALAHNVHLQFVETGVTVFNADSPPDQSMTFIFDEPGGYYVLCDTHPGMSAFVFVTPAPYAAIADDDGAFHVVDVLPGEYTLRVWSAAPELRSEQTISVAAGAATEVRLTPLG